MPRRCADGPRNEHGRELEAAAAADSAMYPTTNPGCVACCFVMGLLLLLRPNRAPSLGGVLHEGEVCASRHASRRPRPRSTHCGQKRGMRHDAPLLLLVAWLGVCSAKGTICSVKPSVCSGTYSSPSLCAAPPPQPTSALAFPARDGGVQRHGGRRAAAALRLASLLLTLTPPDPAPLTQGHRKPSDERLHAYAARGTYRVEHDAP